MANTNPLKCIYCLYERKLRCLSRKGESHRGLCCVRDPLTCMDLSYSHGVENRSLLAAARLLLVVHSTHSNVVGCALIFFFFVSTSFQLNKCHPPETPKKEILVERGREEDAKLKFRPLTIESSCTCQFRLSFSQEKNREKESEVRGKKKEISTNFTFQ